MKRLLLILLAGIIAALFSPPRTPRTTRGSGRESADFKNQRDFVPIDPIEDESTQPKRACVKRWVLRFALFLGVLAFGGSLVALSGIIPLKASSGHWAITKWFLNFGKERSVTTHTLGMKVPPLDEPWMILKGAGHFETGCAPCHGSPLHPQPRVAERMLPRPPNLKFTIGKWKPDELFYIVKHGLKFTGMPAWPSAQRDDEVWAMVAFLQKFPDLDAEEYRRLARGETTSNESAPIENLLPSENEKIREVVVENCARCHGADGLGHGLGSYPKLAGQKLDYLRASLQAYAKRGRHSGIMEPIVANLDSETINQLAHYYANLPPLSMRNEWGEDRGEGNSKLNAPPLPDPFLHPMEERENVIARGEKIAREGIPSQLVPACAECHGPAPTRKNPAYPRLAGQYANYLVLQLELFKKKQRGGTEYSHLMHFAAGQLTTNQMRDVAHYYSSLGAEE